MGREKAVICYKSAKSTAFFSNDQENALRLPSRRAAQGWAKSADE
jgi:hypothetical protein